MEFGIPPPHSTQRIPASRDNPTPLFAGYSVQPFADPGGDFVRGGGCPGDGEVGGLGEVVEGGKVFGVRGVVVGCYERQRVIS